MAALRRDLQPEEDAALRVALDQVNEEAGVFEPTLPMVVDVLLHPREAMVSGVSAIGVAEFAAAARDCALALQHLCEGDLRGMFDGPTSEGIDLDAGVVVLDLSAMRDSEALGILMTCAGAWQQAIFRERKKISDRTGVPMRKTFCVFEEVWRVMMTSRALSIFLVASRPAAATRSGRRRLSVREERPSTRPKSRSRVT